MKKDRINELKKIGYIVYAILIFSLLIFVYPISAQKPNQDEIVFAVYGDVSRVDEKGYEEGRYIHKSIVLNIVSHNPEFVIFVGDAVNEYASETEWGNYLNITEPIRNILYPTPGDNDKPWNTYLEVYSGVYNNSSYYSFNKGDIHIVSLDSNIDFSPSSEQYNWLTNDLETYKNLKWKIIFFHHPPYVYEYYKLKDNQKALVQLFEKYGIDIVFSGHYHLYARSFPVYEDKINTAKGITYIVTGGGGSNLATTFKHNFLFSKSLGVYHFSKIRIFNDTLELSAYDINNKKIDEYKIIKGEETKISFKENLSILLKRYVLNEKLRTHIQATRNFLHS